MINGHAVKPAVQAALLCVQHPLNGTEKLKSILERFTPEDWVEFHRLCDDNSIQIMAHKRLKPLQTGPVELFERLARASADQQAKQMQRIHLALPVLKELNESGVTWLVLKGNALAEELYQDPAYKRMNDIDLLIPRHDLARAWDIFKRNGFQQVASLDEKADRGQEDFSHHWPPLVNRDLTCIFGVHWNLISPLSGAEIPKTLLFEKVESFNFHGLSARRLEPTVFLFHLLIHLSPFKSGLKEIMDPLNFIKHRADDIEWDRLRLLILSSRTWNPAYFSLSALLALQPQATLAEILRALRDGLHDKVSSRVRTWTMERTSDPGLLVTHRTTHFSRIEKAYALFSLSRDPYEKARFLLKMWQLLLWPDRRSIENIFCLQKDTGAFSRAAARIRAPWRISQFFAHEMGWPFFLALTARHELQLARTTAAYGRERVLRGPEAASRNFPPLDVIFASAGLRGLTLEKMGTILE